MPILVLPLGLHDLGTEDPDLLPALKTPPVIMADGIDDKTKDFVSFLYGADPVDEQVYLALNILRASGAAVMNDGQRFQDIRKISDDVVVLIEQEARTALKRLTDAGDITIDSISVEYSSPDGWAEGTIDYVNNRMAKKTDRTVKFPLRPEATSS